MPDLKTTRQKLKIVIIGLIVFDVAAVALLFSPLIGSQQSRRAQMADLWQELQLITKQVEPLRGMDKKIALAESQIDDFYKNRLPNEDSEISEAMGKVASQSGVKMGAVKYESKDEETVGLQPVIITADFSGGYVQLMHFINALEREKLFFIVDSVDFANQQQGGVKLVLKLETYRKTGPLS